MNNYENLDKMSKDELIKLIEIYSKNWLALDGLWFQTVERKYDMDEAMFHDIEVWKLFGPIEARRLKDFLGLHEHPGLEGLKAAMQIRLYANINKDEIIMNENELIYRVLSCRVQSARSRKGMPFHPCKSVGIIEYSGFAKGIDDRIECECLSCYPDIEDESCCCAWRFYLKEDK